MTLHTEPAMKIRSWFLFVQLWKNLNTSVPKTVIYVWRLSCVKWILMLLILSLKPSSVILCTEQGFQCQSDQIKIISTFTIALRSTYTVQYQISIKLKFLAVLTQSHLRAFYHGYLMGKFPSNRMMCVLKKIVRWSGQLRYRDFMR